MHCTPQQIRLQLKRGTPTYPPPQPLSDVNEREKNSIISDRSSMDAICNQLFHFKYVKLHAGAM